MKVENTVRHHLAAMVALSPKGEVGAVLQEICHNRVWWYPKLFPLPFPILIFCTSFIRYWFRYLFSVPNFSGSDTNFQSQIYPVPVLIFSTKFLWFQYYYSIWNFSGTGSGSYFPYQFFLIPILIFGAKIFWYQIPVVLPRFTFSLKKLQNIFHPTWSESLDAGWPRRQGWKMLFVLTTT